MKRIIALIVVVFMLFPVLTASGAGYAFTGQKWDKVNYQTLTLKVKYSTIISNSAKTAFDSAVSDWNSAQSKIKFELSAANTTSQNIVTTQYSEDQSLYGDCDVYYNTSTNKIQYFVAKINIGNNSVNNTAKIARSAAVHELGHAMGLDHVFPPYLAIMNSSRDRETVYIPQKNDKDGINSLYLY